MTTPAIPTEAVEAAARAVHEALREERSPTPRAYHASDIDVARAALTAAIPILYGEEE